MNELLLALSLFISLVASLPALAQTGHWDKVNGSNLSYWLYSPVTIPSRKLSLMITLHGCTQHAQDLVELANWEPAADASQTLVAIPDVPDGGVVLGCWDYYGHDQTETNKHSAPVIHLTEALVKEFAIEPNRISISGLSSGSAQAALVACLRPDLFSGVGLASGPVVGSELGEVYAPKTTAPEAENFCKSLAGARASAFAAQRVSVIYDDHDPLVSPKHSVLSLEMYASLFGTEQKLPIDMSKLRGPNLSGEGFTLSHVGGRTRIASLINRNLGHAWASGKGNSAELTDRYVNPVSVDYPDFLLGFLTRP